jgi:hypothetical protein
LTSNIQIQFKNIWNFNGKYGVIILLKRLTVV